MVAHPRGGWCIARYFNDLMRELPRSLESINLEVVLKDQLNAVATLDRADPHVRLYRPKPKALLARSGLESLLSPEEHCFLDSALEGQQRLADAFVTRLSTPDGVEKAMEGLKGSMEERLKKRAIAISIEEELLLAPWTLTANFQGFKHGRCQLALRGPADPSGRGEGYSYTRLTQAEKAEKARAKTGTDGGAPSTDSVVELPYATGGLHVGTQADFRKMKLSDCIKWLAPHGYTKEQVTALSRSDRIAHIRAIATRQHAQGVAGYEAYARKEPSSTQTSSKFDLEGLAASIWRAQLNALSDPTPPTVDADAGNAGGDEDADAESSDDEFAKELARAMAAAAPETVSAAQDAAELAALRRGDINSHSGTRGLILGASNAGGKTGEAAVATSRRKKTKRIKKTVLRKTSWVEEGGVLVKKVEDFDPSNPNYARATSL